MSSLREDIEGVDVCCDACGNHSYLESDQKATTAIMLAIDSHIPEKRVDPLIVINDYRYGLKEGFNEAVDLMREGMK